MYVLFEPNTKAQLKHLKKWLYHETSFNKQLSVCWLGNGLLKPTGK